MNFVEKNAIGLKERPAGMGDNREEVLDIPSSGLRQVLGQERVRPEERIIANPERKRRKQKVRYALDHIVKEVQRLV